MLCCCIYVLQPWFGVGRWLWEHGPSQDEENTMGPLDDQVVRADSLTATRDGGRDDGFVQIAVADRGRGIPPEDLAHVFHA